MRRGLWVQRLLAHAKLLICLIWATGCFSQSKAPAASKSVVERSHATIAAALRDVRVENLDSEVRVVLSGTGLMRHAAFKEIDPWRLVLDFPNTSSERAPKVLAVENELISKIEIVTLVRDPQPFARVEINLNRDAPFKVSQQQGEIWVSLEKARWLAEAAPASGKTVAKSETKPALPEAAITQKKVASRSSADNLRAAYRPASRQKLAPAKRILGIQPVPIGEALRIHIIVDGAAPQYNAFHLKDPHRLVVDLMGIQWTQVKDDLILNGPLVKKVRVGLHDDRARVVFDLKPQAGLPYEVISGDDRLQVSFKPGSSFPP